MNLETNLNPLTKTNNNTMPLHTDKYFKTKNTMKNIDFSRTVILKTDAQDFISDNTLKDEIAIGKIEL